MIKKVSLIITKTLLRKLYSSTIAMCPYVLHTLLPLKLGVLVFVGHEPDHGLRGVLPYTIAASCHPCDVNSHVDADKGHGHTSL